MPPSRLWKWWCNNREPEFFNHRMTWSHPVTLLLNTNSPGKLPGLFSIIQRKKVIGLRIGKWKCRNVNKIAERKNGSRVGDFVSLHRKNFSGLGINCITGWKDFTGPGNVVNTLGRTRTIQIVPYFRESRGGLLWVTPWLSTSSGRLADFREPLKNPYGQLL